MNTRPSTTPTPVAPCAECLTQTTNKTKVQTQSSADRITISLSPVHQKKNKTRLSTDLTLYEAYTNHWTNLRRAKTKRKKEFNLEAWEKETSNTISLKKIMKRQRNTAQMKEKTRNTEVQIIEEEIGKLPEKEFRIMIVKMIKNLENRMEKIQK